MRNEIFARYGYIFNSEDLANHFNTKAWYSPINSNVDDHLTNVDKSNIELILRFENLAKKQSFQPTIESKTDAYFRVINDPITGDKLEISRNVTFHRHYKFGTIRKIIERTFTGAEKNPTVIYSETIDSNSHYWATTKYFDDLKFETDFYHAIEYGCCGAENYGELYSYSSDEPILKFNNDFFFVDIPNSKIEMFIGYSHQEFRRDGLSIAKLSLSSLEGVISTITFIAKDQRTKEDLPWYWTPKIELRSDDEKNQIITDLNEIRLWGCDFAKTLNDINGFSVFVEFQHEGSGKIKNYEIPITKGKFYGLSQSDTEIILDFD